MEVEGQSLARTTLRNGMLDHLLEGCQIIGPDWRYLYVNAAATKQARRSREELLGRTMMEVYPGIEGSPMFAVLRRCMEKRRAEVMENEFRFPDGAKGWFELRFQPVPEGVFILSLEITERKRAEEERRVIFDVLALINEAERWEDLLRSVLDRLKRWSGCEAVGIRLKQGPDFPYFVAAGFPAEFIEMENRLCSYGEDGEVLRDEDGNPVRACMCGNILDGRCDPSKSFFTSDGCFWSNCTTDLLATTTDVDRQTRTRNRCNGEGYESVALIPLRSRNVTFGLIQFNDRRKERFTPESIALYRRIADHIANSLARAQAEANIAHLNAVLRGIRNVNQLITREKSRSELIRKACDLLVEARGFHAVVVGLTDVSGKALVEHAGAGPKAACLQGALGHGTIPECARQAMEKREIVVRVGPDPACRGCPVVTQWDGSQHTMGIALEHEDRLYGFMLTWLLDGRAEEPEEHDLLREVAGDIAFALRGIQIEAERDKSAADLLDTEEQLRQAQKLEAVGRLAGGVAHDFNNILMAQMGYCDLMKEELRPDDPLAQDLDQLRECAERAAGLTRQLLAFSRKQTLQPEVLDVNAVVANIERMLRRVIGEDIDFMLVLSRDVGRVKADPGQLEQVIMNLAVNARDAMPEGGRLTIETANVHFDESYAQTHVDVMPGPHVLLAISDTGCGMDVDTQSRLFEPFFTTKELGKGTGLGLATVYGIVKQSGGHIWVYSEVGKGTSFKIYLPRVDAEPALHSGQESQTALGNGELILVVEDDPALQSLFGRMIRTLGYQARVVANGGEALLAIEEEGITPDLLVTDVVMPGMSGKVLVERLSRTWPSLKVLYMSGYTDNAIVHHGVLDPEAQFLQKPFNSVSLAAKIREVLGR